MVILSGNSIPRKEEEIFSCLPADVKKVNSLWKKANKERKSSSPPSVASSSLPLPSSSLSSSLPASSSVLGKR
ncbi:hypothetical protein Glove_360g5 [Diversispora epigaea]|uniref:Uncharacterized protein n=1 Tax=Diversispora epigaea TaxID=1348612 RepID=A0A397HCX9_9GLOM|nr:hypothetical protein Glove_360g5 [Diversispora epigaea]